MFFKKKQEARTYNRENQKPVIHSSICTGEKVAGFQNIRTGKFTEVMLIRTSEDLDEFHRLTASAKARFSPNTEENRADPKNGICSVFLSFNRCRNTTLLK